MARIYDKNPKLLGKDPDVRSRRYITPCRIVWTSRENGADVANEECLLTPRAEQLVFADKTMCVLKNTPGKPRASVLVDYGTELHGTVRVMLGEVTGEKPDGFFHQRANIRIHLGESAMEAMSDIGVKNATNDHSNRDFSMEVGGWSAPETGESGFRFMRIELLDEEASLAIKSVNATFIFRDVEYKGSFDCSDPLLNRIWDTAAYTVQLNMQEYLWDGIKRDRLVWIGDMHTEVSSVLTVFGDHEIIERSLDLVRDETPLGSWMNGMSSYSLWWIIIQHDLYVHWGNIEYLKTQKEYLLGLLSILSDCVDENGIERMPPDRFIDWPSRNNNNAVHAGLQGLLKIALERGAELLETLGENKIADKCITSSQRMSRHVPDCAGSKQAASLLILAGIGDKDKIHSEVISPGGAMGYSTFFGYYILAAKALAGDLSGALEDMKAYFGGMLDVGATTFWEDFNILWLENASRIDQPVPEGKTDIHGAYGDFCYKGFRHSLCHGWASGPCPFLTQYVLGVRALAHDVYEIKPNLASLEWARGSVPTPHGSIEVSAKKVDGKVIVDINSPQSITVITS